MMATMPSNDETRKAIQEIVRAFGFDPGNVRSFEFRMAVDSLVTVKAEVYLEIDQMRQAATVLKRYKIVPLEENVPSRSIA